MSASLRIDTSEWIAGALLIGNTGLGVLGAAVPAGGTDGASCLYPTLQLPADAATEVCARLTRTPGGTLFLNEDGSFTYSGGADYFEFLLIAGGTPSSNDIGYGPGISRVTLGIGSTSSFSGNLAEADDSASGAFGPASASALAGDVVEDADVLSGGLAGPVPVPVAQLAGSRVVKAGRQAPVWLAALDVGEVDDVAFDFTPALRGTDVVASVNVTIEARVGVDPDAAAMRVGNPAVGTSTVLQRLQSGLAGVTYLLRAQATFSPSGRKATAAAFIAVVRQA